MKSRLRQIRSKALLPADKIDDNQSHAEHPNRQETKHNQDGQVLGLGDDAVGIGFAGGAGECHGRKIKR